MLPLPDTEEVLSEYMVNKCCGVVENMYIGICRQVLNLFLHASVDLDPTMVSVFTLHICNSYYE